MSIISSLIKIKKHLLAFILASTYMVVVLASPIGETPTEYYFTIQLTSETTETPDIEIYLEDLERIALATVIDTTYRGIDYLTAERLLSAVYEYSNNRDIDPLLIVSMVATESSFRKTARSSAGALGYMQVIPKWHKDKIQGRDIFNLETNIEVGVQVIYDCMNRRSTMYSALACYNGAITPSKAQEYYNSVFTHYEFFNSSLSDVKQYRETVLAGI